MRDGESGYRQEFVYMSDKKCKGCPAFVLIVENTSTDRKPEGS